MKLLQRLFGKKQSSETTTANPSETLFTEQSPPAEDIIHAAFHQQYESAPAPVSPRGFVYTRPTEIREFLNKVYCVMGQQDALLNPSTEVRNNKLDAIGKRFRFTVQHVQEQLVAQMHQLRQTMILMGDVSPMISQQQNLRLQELQDMLDKLEMQVELSVDGEGWIAPVLADYKDGFIAGAIRYQRENELLSGLNTLT